MVESVDLIARLGMVDAKTISAIKGEFQECWEDEKACQT